MAIKKKTDILARGTSTVVPTVDPKDMVVEPPKKDALGLDPKLFETKNTPSIEQNVKNNVQAMGGYVDETGKYIPSINPGKKIDFNKDGSISYTTATGQSYKLTKDEYSALIGRSGTVTKNVSEIKAFESGALEQEQKRQALSNLGLNEQQIMAIESGLVEAPIDWGQALTAGAANILPSAVGGAAGGAAIGAFAGGIGAAPGAAIGAVGGLVTGLFKGIIGNIKQQQSGEIRASQDVLAASRTNMRRLSTLAAKDPNNAAAYVDLYNQQLMQVYQAQRKIKLETSGNLNKFMEDGTDILSDFDLFLQPGGQAEIYRMQLEMALMTGKAPEFTLEDFAE